MSGRHRDRSRDREQSKVEQRHGHERRRHSRSASPPRRRSRSRSREHGSSSKPSRRVERSKSPRRRHERSRSRDRHRSRSRSRSRDREHKRHKGRRRSSRSRSSSNDAERRRRKKEKKEKKKEKHKNKALAAAEWGKYGVIGEVDMRDKDPEFRTWLIEEKVVNPETSSDDQLKKLFKEFAEDYNTATLPHEKYYNMDAYQRRMRLVRAGESNLLEGLDTYDPNADVLAHTKGMKRAPKEDTILSREELEELRKVKMERDQIGQMKLLGMNIGSKTGVRMDTTYE